MARSSTTRETLRIPATVVAAGLICGILLPGCRSPEERRTTGGETRPAPRPDVVLYLVDTLRPDRLGVYGHDRPTSPNLDALADDSVVVEEAVAPAPWTLPSLVSLMTSTYPCEHGVTSRGTVVSETLTTLAEVLREEGYATAALFANQYAGSFAGLDRGFDVSHLMGKRARGNPEALVEMLLEDPPPGPLFLSIHTVEPHDPYLVSDEDVALFGEVGAETRGRVNALNRHYRLLTTLDWREDRPIGTTDTTEDQIQALAALEADREAILSLYDASIRVADRRMVRVIETLKRLGRWENTLFVFLSDHGEELGEHGGWQHDQSLYQELVRVPLVIRFPGDRYAGTRLPGPVPLIDVLPTILDTAGAEIPATVRGRSLVPNVQEGGEGARADPVPMSVRINEETYFRPWEESRGDRNLALWQGRFKGIVSFDVRRLELYDLLEDPEERRSVAEDHRALARRMVETARSWWDACLERREEHVPGKREEALSEREMNELRALGYVE